MFADLSLSDEDLSRIYSRAYFFGEEYADYTADEPALRRNFASRLRVLDRFTDPTLHGKLVEIGCAYGFFLDEAGDRFQDRWGIDLNPDGVHHARTEFGVNAVQGDFLDVELSRGVYVGCLWDTIEHLRDPARYIEHFARAAEPGSLLAVTTGDIGSLVARARGDQWRQIHPPSHIHYFSVRTLVMLLQRQGFEVVYTGHAGFWRSIDMVLYRILALRAGKKDLYAHIPQVLKHRFFYLNLFDIMYVIARRV